MGRGMRRIFWMIALAAGVASGEGMLQKGVAPITLHLPGTVAAGRPIPLAGETLPKLGDVGVTIRCRSSVKGSPEREWKLRIPVEESGAFRSSFTETRETGECTVEARAPDGKGRVRERVRIVAPSAAGEGVVRRMESVAGMTAEGLSKLEKRLDRLPASPAVDELKKRMKEAAERVREGPPRFAALGKSLKRVGSQVRKRPEMMEIYTPLYEALEEEEARLAEAEGEIRETFDRLASRRPTRCDDIDAIVSGLEFSLGSMQVLMMAISGVGKGSAKALEVLDDKAIELFNKTKMEEYKNLPGSRAPLPVEEIQLGKSYLNALISNGSNLEKWKGSTADLLTAAAGYATGKILEHYCVKWSGDFTADFGAQFFAYGKKWWAYDLRLKGKLNLRYAKGNVSGEQRVSGEFEGNAVRFRVWDDLMAATPYMKRYVVFHSTLPPLIPPGAKAIANEFGKMGRYGFGPYAFLIPVHGVIKGRKMMLEVDEAVRDYGDRAKGIAWYIMVEPSLPVPYVMTADLPMMKAQFILSRGMRGKAVFDIGTKGKRMSIQRTFTRREKADNGEYDVAWRVKVRACNPECR